MYSFVPETFPNETSRQLSVYIWHLLFYFGSLLTYLSQIPPTVDILTALPNMLSALCLNERGLNSFLQSQPFDRLFSILISPEYLGAMRKRKNLDSNMTTGFIYIILTPLTYM